MFRHLLTGLLERMIAVVAPVQGDQVSRQGFQGFRVLEDYVAPEHHFSAPLVRKFFDPFEEVYIDMGGAVFVTTGFTPSLTEFPGFVAADIKIWAIEYWQILGMKFIE